MSSPVNLHWASSSAVVGVPHIPRLIDSRGSGEMPSLVLTPIVLQQLAAAAPSRFALADWRLLYSTAVHGISLNTCYSRAQRCGSCVVAIKSEDGNVFGAFCSEWREPAAPPAFYGSGETFLFSVERVQNLPPLPSGEPPPHEAVHLHRWSGANSFFMLSDRDHFAVGSGGHFGLWCAHICTHPTHSTQSRAYAPHLSSASCPGLMLICCTAAVAPARRLVTTASAGNDARAVTRALVNSAATRSRCGEWTTAPLHGGTLSSTVKEADHDRDTRHMTAWVRSVVRACAQSSPCQPKL